MLREIKTREGRAQFVPFLRILASLKLVSENTIHLAILSVVFSELVIRAKI